MFSKIFKYFKRDALAGTITGTMAVPLTVGICLMSDYPIMTGLYTVIFACIVSFLVYLFKPGNFVGTPGVAAGLAPALALGVSTFGIENMPFVIVLTVAFQVLVWHFKWERFILQLVPHYLVEGLLAGVGLKIAYKFVPYLYETTNKVTHEHLVSLPLILALSAVSFVVFVMTYQKFKDKMPALPYLLIMGTSILLSFFIELPMVAIDSIPFHLALPLPHFDGLTSMQISITLLKMIGFALMLGTIDVIEQVMSNVAIEKLDPLDRRCDTNNSLLTIWIANLGSTFFGGMTNLDGLAKSTTNAVAGAYTKLSNLFTALVLFIVVLFPQILDHFPKYALAIIMVYSGWKMIANIAHVRKDGRYALALSVVCGLLVFEMGIFEGLLVVLAFHYLVQWSFKSSASKSLPPKIACKSYIDVDSIPLLAGWKNAINNGDTVAVTKYYADNCIFNPAFSTRVRYGRDDIANYYKDLHALDNLFLEIYDVEETNLTDTHVYCGTIGIGWSQSGIEETHVMRFSMTVSDDQIINQYTSMLPIGDISIASWNERQDKRIDFIF